MYYCSCFLCQSVFGSLNLELLQRFRYCGISCSIPAVAVVRVVGVTGDLYTVGPDRGDGGVFQFRTKVWLSAEVIF